MPAFSALIWWVLAIVMVVSALLVIHVRDIFKAALFLVVTFVSVVGFFVMLRAEFLAVVQLLIYAGAISVLIIFAVMLTRDVHTGNPFNRLRVPGITLGALFLAVIAFTVIRGPWREQSGLTETAPVQAILTHTPSELGALLTEDFVLPLEIAAVLLVSAIIGAIVLVRER